MSERWQRWAGIAGLVFVASIVASFFLPSTPDLGVADAELGPAIEQDARGLGAGVYLLSLGAVAFVVFASGLAGRLRRGEGERAGASIGLIAGAVMFGVQMLVAAGVTLALVAASSEGRDPAAVRALFELDNVVFVPAGFALALTLFSAAVGILSTRTLPAWLGWGAGFLAVTFAVGMLGVMSADEEGGPLGVLFWLGLLGALLWVLAAAALLLRQPRPAGAPVSRRVATPSV